MNAVIVHCALPHASDVFVYDSPNLINERYRRVGARNTGQAATLGDSGIRNRPNGNES